MVFGTTCSHLEFLLQNLEFLLQTNRWFYYKRIDDFKKTQHVFTIIPRHIKKNNVPGNNRENMLCFGGFRKCIFSRLWASSWAHDRHNEPASHVPAMVSSKELNNLLKFTTGRKMKGRKAGTFLPSSIWSSRRQRLRPKKVTALLFFFSGSRP